MAKPLHGRTLDRRGLAERSGDARAAGGVRAVTSSDGDGRGVRILEFRTAAGLDADVLVDRAMDLGEMRMRGRNLAFLSPTGVRHPAFHQGEEEDGLGFLRSFTGALVTVGLDHAFGPAERDAARYAYPSRRRVLHGLHGRIANLPARLIGYGEHWDEDGRCTLWAEGHVRQAAVFGEHLTMRRRIEAPLHAARVRIVDVVTNEGFEAVPHRLLWHVDFGWPLVDDATLLRLPADEGAEPREVGPLGPPIAGRPEEVAVYRPVADEEGRAEAAIVNPELGLGARIRWRTDAMPAFVLWTHLRAGAYAVGYEPSTHAIGDPDGPHGELSPGESRRYELELEAADGDVARGWLAGGA